jgi:hypothetical protein
MLKEVFRCKQLLGMWIRLLDFVFLIDKELKVDTFHNILMHCCHISEVMTEMCLHFN